MASSLEGVARLSRQLRELGKLDDGKAIRSAVREAIKPAESRARAMVPVGSRVHMTYKGRVVTPGFAKRSIRVEVSLSKDKQAAFADLGARKEAFYIVQFVELGTSKMAAQPWLRPAFESTINQQEAGLEVSLRKSVEKATHAR